MSKYLTVNPSDMRQQSEVMNLPATETELVVFKRSPIHGIGGFAKENIAKGVRVLEYVGERIDRQESMRRCQLNNTFIFALDQEHDLDGNIPENPARWLNHACSPNCDAESDNGRIWIVARREIVAGEELTFNYGYDLTDYRHYPCSCGSPDCLGYIVAEEFHEHVRRNTSRSHTF